MNKAVFLDRDGVINIDCVDYTYKVEEFQVIQGVVEALGLLKEAGYKLVVITNQSGISKGIYGHDDVAKCHEYFDRISGNLIDEYYYSPYHETYTASLTRKPGTLMFERAIAKFKVDPAESWMVGDKERDVLPAKKLGIRTILIPEDGKRTESADHVEKDLLAAAKRILTK